MKKIKKSQFKSDFCLIALLLLCGLAGLDASAQNGRCQPKPEGPPKMDYVQICKSAGDCKQFSRLVMGTDHLGETNWSGDGAPQKSDEEVYRVLDEAARHGITLYDTSPIYVGGIENRLGKWRALRTEDVKKDNFYYNPEPTTNPDRKLYALSKGGFPYDLSYSNLLEAGVHSPQLIRELYKKGIIETEGSNTLTEPLALQNVPAGTYASRLFGSQDQISKRVSGELGHIVGNLGDVVDICLMHRDDGDAIGFKAIKRPQTEVKTIMQALSEPELSKHCWGNGWSNWKTKRVDDSLKLAEENPSLVKPQINSPYFSLFEMNPRRSIHALGVQVTHKDMMDPNFQKGIHIMPYSPLGGFSILDQPYPTWENAKAHAKKKYDQRDPYWRNVYRSIFTKENEARFNRVVEFTKKWNDENCTDYTVDQMVNAYALAHTRVDFLAVGPTDIDQVRRTVRALQLSKELEPEDLEYLYSGKRPPKSPRPLQPQPQVSDIAQPPGTSPTLQ